MTALHKLNALLRRLRRGLDATAGLWPPIRKAFAAVWEAAHILANHDELTSGGVRVRFNRLLARMSRHKPSFEPLTPAITHFITCAHSYGPGLFHSYDFAELPRTNNILEQYFGSARYHERRISGHKVNSPGTLVRGPARLLAAVATRLSLPTVADLRPRSVLAWREFRQQLEFRHEARRKLRRFRRDPAAYLTALEQRLVKPILPT